jgi:hypothetical protein
VITGDAIRTRRRAEAIAAAIAWESSVPCPGVNQARAAFPWPSSTRVGSTRPLFSTSGRAQSSSKFSP